LPISNSGAEGAFGLPQKFPVRETNIPSLRFMDEGSFRVINNQPLNPSEEKEIVCRIDYLTPLTVDPPIQSCCCSLMEWLKRYC